MSKSRSAKSVAAVIIALMAVAAIGCSGRLYTLEEGNACVVNEGVCTGVAYHPLDIQEREFVRDRILDNEGKVTHHMNATGATQCNPVAMKASILAPVREAKYLWYDSAFFETSKFNVTLFQNGALNSVGTESTPGGKALVESLEILAGVVTGVEDDADKQQKLGRFLKNGAPWCSHGELPAELLQ